MTGEVRDDPGPGDHPPEPDGGGAIDWHVPVPPIEPGLAAAIEGAPGFLPVDEGQALYEVAVRAAAVGPLLEVGSWLGRSALHLAAAARTVGRAPGWVVTVDHHRGSEEHQPGWEYHDPSLWDDEVDRLDTLPRLRRMLHDAGVEDEVVVAVTSSTTLASLWGRPLGLVFIDGSHTHDSAMADWEAWAPHVALGGVLAVHDVFEDPADGGQAPYHLWRRALDSGLFEPRPAAGRRSLRVLQRIATSSS